MTGAHVIEWPFKHVGAGVRSTYYGVERPPLLNRAIPLRVFLRIPVIVTADSGIVTADSGGGRNRSR